VHVLARHLIQVNLHINAQAVALARMRNRGEVDLRHVPFGAGQLTCRA